MKTTHLTFTHFAEYWEGETLYRVGGDQNGDLVEIVVQQPREAMTQSNSLRVPMLSDRRGCAAGELSFEDVRLERIRASNGEILPGAYGFCRSNKTWYRKKETT